jgi:hypothetical protein
MISKLRRMAGLSAILLAVLSLIQCEKQAEEDFLWDHQEIYALAIWPTHPTSVDPILLIELTCGFEPEPILSFKGNQILYKRYFNSLMGAPCIPTLDTTTIGPLDAGSYELIHWVIDKNHLMIDSIVSLDTIPLVVVE